MNLSQKISQIYSVTSDEQLLERLHNSVVKNDHTWNGAVPDRIQCNAMVFVLADNLVYLVHETSITVDISFSPVSISRSLTE